MVSEDHYKEFYYQVTQTYKQLLRFLCLSLIVNS
jgi:hypothetical protein